MTAPKRPKARARSEAPPQKALVDEVMARVQQIAPHLFAAPAAALAAHLQPPERLAVFCCCCDARLPEPATDAEAIGQGYALQQYASRASGEIVRAWRCPTHHRLGEVER